MGRFTDEENLLIAMSFKKISEDPVVGCDQNLKTLWKRVGIDYRARCLKHFTDPALAKAAIDWPDDSLTNRYNRFMKQALPHYNKAVKTTVPHSGESDDQLADRQLLMYAKLTQVDVSTVEKEKLFLKNTRYLPPCAEVLNKMAQFGGTHGNADHDNRAASGSVFTAVETPRPVGCKKAKRKMHLDADSAEKKGKIMQAKLDALQSMQETIAQVAKATASMAATLKKDNSVKRSDHLVGLAEQYAKLGETDKAKSILKSILDSAEAQSPQEISLSEQEGSDKENHGSNSDSDDGSDVAPKALMRQLDTGDEYSI